MTPNELAQLVAPLGEIAEHVGEAIMSIYQKNFGVITKPDGSPVTEADMTSHKILLEQLTKLLPDTPVVSEEADQTSYKDRSAWSTYWLIDPLDGTQEFVKRSGEFTINIALMNNSRPILGLVYMPAKNWLHWGYQDGGAWRAKNGAIQKIKVLDYRGGRACIAASRSHGQGRLTKYLDNLQRKEGDYDLRVMGSAAKICLVAEGSAHLYPRFGPTSEWDTAAADIILSEAGGQLFQQSMRLLEYNKRSLLNPGFFACCAGGYDWSKLLDSDLANQ